jgi:methyl-accepting chemotaxis protein
MRKRRTFSKLGTQVQGAQRLCRSWGGHLDRPPETFMLTLDFAVAKLRHTSWKTKLRRFLDGDEALSPAQATDHHACDVGRWLHAPGTGGLAKWSSLPEVRELDTVHSQMHAAVKRVIEAKSAGRDADAEREFAAAVGHSERVVELLTTLEAAVARHAA